MVFGENERAGSASSEESVGHYNVSDAPRPKDGSGVEVSRFWPKQDQYLTTTMRGYYAKLELWSLIVH